MTTREVRAGRATAVVLLALTGLALGPVLLHRGVVLVGDMTFVPQQPWKAAWLGLDGSVPRAVPADALVSMLTDLLPGDLVQKAILVATLFLAGLGVVRLLAAVAPRLGRIAGLAGATLYLWNPYVLERLAIGHWGLLVGYAALPWVVLAADRLRHDRRGAMAMLVCWLAVAAVGSPTGGLLAGTLALILTAGRPARRPAGVALVVLVLNLPWLVPGVLARGIGTDPAGVRAFAAAADTPLGVLGSLATFGGIWKQSIVPGERAAWLLVLLATAATLAGLTALTAVGRGRGPRASRLDPAFARRLLLAGGLGLVLALLPVTAAGANLAERLVSDVPGAGLLRDSQKFVALFVLATCVGFAVAVDHLTRAAVRHGLNGRVVGGAAVVLPLLLLPSLAWGLSGGLEPVRIPSDWARAESALAAMPADQRRTVVLPFSTYQRFSWNGGRATVDPAIRFFAGQIVTADQLVLGPGVAVGGDSPASARIAEALRAGRPLGPVLRDLGIRFVLVERTAAGAAAVAVPPGRIVYDGPEIRLFDLGGPARLEHADHGWMIVTADLLAAALLLGAGTYLAVRRFLRKPDVIG